MTTDRAHAGLYLPQVRMDFAAIERRARAAEECGFHSVWFIDHLAPPAGRDLDMLDAWTVATAVAMRTERLRVGHLVLCAEFRHPALLAKMAASLDVLSGGRLELGLGWGSVARELTDYGFTDPGPAARAGRLAETIDILRLLWSGEPVDFDGEHWTLRAAVCRPRPVDGRVPIHIGGAGSRLTMPLVASRADWWNCPSSAADRLAELRPSAGAARISIQHPIGLAASSATRDEVVETTRRRFGAWGGVVAGTPDEVAEALSRERAAGAELFVCQFHDFGTPETIRLFAEEVLPALR
ncbi:Flavin-dependent oxidoreductase, luciferase family (includes alkanesulfonate monooxygenase SsuD and methylene tetrahydromethanopterin reductase) [Thermomonospora echinospora]|uniref:Flavin-dependent oxidoreductase, luciferase family (Includes alkanesulfonate monooxygenase SsuD and methylene tetrahydromethanopterin reductase) n=1 Tax=Thermomonospora echinospora TaxID=1992 RepID=A0A1H6E743_9ACTN|nr:LLM class flavin-dependent oxidoreductase [Thermomonospora echinospora]SEG92989.1 Flavin-dependent oxidoreductase, luciferase family (includes alkanesulfonate monooxygenase SsuD and methylene tetrahydromethanopterin reductase) [Thermomonospora echinospora]